MELTDSTTRSKADPGSERMSRVVSKKLMLPLSLFMNGNRLVPASVCAYEKTPMATAKMAKAVKSDSFSTGDGDGVDSLGLLVDVVDLARERDFFGFFLVAVGCLVASCEEKNQSGFLPFSSCFGSGAALSSVRLKNEARFMLVLSSTLVSSATFRLVNMRFAPRALMGDVMDLGLDRLLGEVVVIHESVPTGKRTHATATVQSLLSIMVLEGENGAV